MINASAQARPRVSLPKTQDKGTTSNQGPVTEGSATTTKKVSNGAPGEDLIPGIESTGIASQDSITMVDQTNESIPARPNSSDNSSNSDMSLDTNAAEQELAMQREAFSSTRAGSVPSSRPEISNSTPVKSLSSGVTIPILDLIDQGPSFVPKNQRFKVTLKLPGRIDPKSGAASASGSPALVHPNLHPTSTN